jgi:hypothetical protein
VRTQDIRNGTFQFRGLQKTQDTIIVRAAGYREAQQQVNLQIVSSEYVQLQLTADPNARKESEPAAIAGILDANVPPDAQKEFAAGRKAMLEAKKFEEGRKHLEKALSIWRGGARNPRIGRQIEKALAEKKCSGFHMCETSLVGFLTQRFKGSKVQGRKSP